MKEYYAKEYYAKEFETAKDQHLLRHINFCLVNESRLQFKSKKKCRWKISPFQGCTKEVWLGILSLYFLPITLEAENTARKKLNVYVALPLKSPIKPSNTISCVLLQKHSPAQIFGQKYLCTENIQPVSEEDGGLKSPYTKTMSLNLSTKKHVDDKDEAANFRKFAKANNDQKTLVISFDFVFCFFALHSTHVSSAFYKRKLNCYNLTAMVARTKVAFLAVWVDTTYGRSGNYRSALTHLLNNILPKYPNAENMILWSDSCVAQNRNQILSFALQLFIESKSKIKSIIHCYCDPGHSNIQDFDNLHSNIECALCHKEIHSLVSLVRLFKLIKSSRQDMYVCAGAPMYEKIGYTVVKDFEINKDRKQSVSSVKVLKTYRARVNLIKTLSQLKSRQHAKCYQRKKLTTSDR
ncbi:unnamed protein product [Lepeophtheirus salmonis]|uniref:(salmon louse) hypothetical protein n=1 Tax=Lepeophtheirus salmonis TaxID=72036 RepID=A0A7R8CUT7_LEPSM|nr:unnamed protein product [Lepeophtheirus salmonis]CAF2939154.1 unnamed protein product [Lepeophtheirus salmonis]